MPTVLIRHLPPLIEPGICYGRLDVAPDPACDDQARAIAMHPALSGVTQVWTSPAHRCRALADEIVRVTSRTAAADPRLRELDFGEWEGRPWDMVDRSALDRWAESPLTFAPPGGESGAALIARVREFHDRLLHDGRNAIVVSHGGPLKILAALLSGAPVDLLAAAPAFGSVNIVTGSVRLPPVE